MKKSTLLILTAVVLCLSVIPAFAQDNCDINMIMTQIAPTVIAEYKQSLQMSNYSDLTPVLESQGLQIVPKPTATPIGWNDPNSVVIAAQPTATPMTGSVNKASYDSQSPEDGTHVKHGQDFDITWYLLNTGTTTWNSDYGMRFFTGTNFTKPGKDRWRLGTNVAPGQVAACKVDARAPEKPGTYTMSVQLEDDKTGAEWSAESVFMIVDITIIVD